MGPSATHSLSPSGKRRDHCAPVSGNWALTPDQAQVTFTTATFVLDTGTSAQESFSNCVVTYDRTKTSGASLLNCPISIPQGNIVAVHIGFKNSFQVLIADSTNCIFTDGTAFTNVAPAQAQFSTFTVTPQQGDFDIESRFPTAFTVKAGDTPTLSVVADMVHAMDGTVSGSTMTYDNSLPKPLVNVFASFSTTGSSQYYAPSPTSTALNVNIGSVTGGEAGIRVSYLSSSVVAHVWNEYIPNCAMGNYPTEAWNANPADSPADGSGNRAGGFAGIDSGNVISWALPVDFTYAAYRTVIELPKQTALGSTAHLACEFLNGGAAPLPTSGDTYASLHPTLSGTVYNTDYILVAQ
jgi:hypothetical protein